MTRASIEIFFLGFFRSPFTYLTLVFGSRFTIHDSRLTVFGLRLLFTKCPER